MRAAIAATAHHCCCLSSIRTRSLTHVISTVAQASLYNAADAGDLSGVRRALENGADVNGVNVVRACVRVLRLWILNSELRSIEHHPPG